MIPTRLAVALIRLVFALMALALARPDVSYAAASDSSHAAPAGRMSGAGSYQRLMAEADSLLKLRGGSHAENTQLYLSWNAPWGMKRAARTRLPVCSDSTLADTLYLSFYPGRSADHFSGFTGDVNFLATGQDTLGPWWHMESKGGENGGNITVEWGPSPDMPGRQPWQTAGHGFAMIDRTPQAMRLRLLFAVTLDDAGPLSADVTYTLCRVIVRHRPARHLAGCEQPVCVQWARATLGYALKDEPEVRRGERLVSYSGSYSICEPFREAARVKSWQPPKLPAVPGSK